MSSGAGIDAATFEQLKATLYKANGGARARAIVKTKKRSVRGGGFPIENGVPAEGEEPPLTDRDIQEAQYIQQRYPTLFEKLKNMDYQLTDEDEDELAEVEDNFNKEHPIGQPGGKKRGGAPPPRPSARWGILGTAARAVGNVVTFGAIKPNSYMDSTKAAEGEEPLAAPLTWELLQKEGFQLNEGVTDVEQLIIELNANITALNDAPPADNTVYFAAARAFVTTLAELFQKITYAPAPAKAPAGGGARRRITKRKGGALDMNKLYNVQGLIGNSFSKDPMQRAGTVIDDRTPLPFSAGTSGAINQSFISDLNPVLGQMGGARKRVADGRRRKAQRGGAPPLSQEEATKLIGDFLISYDEISSYPNFAAYLEDTFQRILVPIYRMVINLYEPLNEEKLWAATLENIGESTRLPLIKPNIISELTNKYTELEPEQFVFPLNARMSIAFANSELLYNKDSKVDVGLIVVLLQAILQLLNPNKINQIITHYFNMEEPKRNYDVELMNALYTIRTNLNIKCLLLYQLAVLLLQHISDLIENKTYITSYTMTEMEKVISVARAENAVKQIRDIRNTGVTKAINTYTKPPPAGAAGGRKKRA